MCEWGGDHQGWAGISGTCEMEGRPRMSSGGDMLMLISKSLFKVNIWGWQLVIKWTYGAIRPMHL